MSRKVIKNEDGQKSKEILELLEKNKLDKAISSGLSYLINIQNIDGKFAYIINHKTNKKKIEKYNIRHHAGTLYAMANCVSIVNNDRLSEGLKRGASYLWSNHVREVEGHDFMAVWSDPSEHKTIRKQAKLGATGLSLAALLSVEKSIGVQYPLKDLQALGDFIIFMQKKLGNFHFRYVPSIEGNFDDFVSNAYPGEAALGLLMLYEKDPQPKWFGAATKAIRFLILKSRMKGEHFSDHWMLKATEKWMTLKEDNKWDDEASLFKEHAVHVCVLILKEFIKSWIPGCFSGDFRTLPTSTRCDGLIAALNFLQNQDKSFLKGIENAVDLGLIFLLNGQIIRKTTYRRYSKVSPTFT